MKKKIDLIFADTGDWVALYIDGDLVRQGHELCPEDLLDALGIEYAATYNVPVRQFTDNRFPTKLAQIAEVPLT